MKKITTLALAALTAATILTGCTQKTAGTVSTDGSTSMEKVIGALGESFQEQNEGAAFTYNPTGSGSGIQAVMEGRCDIGLSSRELKEEEASQGLTATVLAYDGIAVIVNPENPVADLETETIAKLYTGEIENWKDAGGNDAPVVLIGREAGSGTPPRDPEPGRHRIRFPGLGEGQCPGHYGKRRGSHRRYREGRQLRYPAPLYFGDENRGRAFRNGPGLLRLRHLRRRGPADFRRGRGPGQLRAALWKTYRPPAHSLGGGPGSAGSLQSGFSTDCSSCLALSQ